MGKEDTKKPIEVAAGLVFRAGQVLITQRHPNSHLGGLWEFPGGKVEPNETFEQCLHRELREELGIVVQIVALLDRVVHAYPEKTVEIRFFKCRWLAKEPQALGCPDFRWVRSNEIDSFSFPPADAHLLESLRTNEDWWAG